MIESRRKRMAALALADADQLAQGLAALGPWPSYTLPRPPEAGLIMVRGRFGNTGSAFNLGEMLVTRCAVSLEGRLGQAWVPGWDFKKAELAALGDALGQIEAYAGRLEPLLAELEADRLRRRRAAEAETGATRVQFLTMVRGEDKDE